MHVQTTGSNNARPARSALDKISKIYPSFLAIVDNGVVDILTCSASAAYTSSALKSAAFRTENMFAFCPVNACTAYCFKEDVWPCRVLLISAIANRSYNCTMTHQKELDYISDSVTQHKMSVSIVP